MFSIEQLRKEDPKLKNLSDEEITEVRDKLYALGDLMFDCWLAKRQKRWETKKNKDTCKP